VAGCAHTHGFFKLRACLVRIDGFSSPNRSPLLTPDDRYPNSNNQRAAAETLAVAMDFAEALRGDPGFRLGFNSAGSSASVNHLHFQVCLPMHVGRFRRVLALLVFWGALCFVGGDFRRTPRPMRAEISFRARLPLVCYYYSV